MLFREIGKQKYIKWALLLLVLGLLFLVIFMVLVSLGFGPSKLFGKGGDCISQLDGYKKWDCMSPYFEKLVYEESVIEAMKEAIEFKEERVVADCHLFGHLIGETGLEKNNFDVGKTFSSCVHGCSDGCFHGVMERYLRNEIDPYNVVSNIQNICDSVGTDWVLKRQCFHGVGHGLLAHGYLSFQEAIDTCQIFDLEWILQCMGGVVMENMDQYLRLDLNEDDFRKVIPKICEQVESTDPFSQDCFNATALGFLYYTGYDLRRSESLCEELSNFEHVQTCKYYVIRNMLDERPSNLKGF